MIEPTGIVVGDTRRQQGALPFDSWSFKPFELFERREQAFFPSEFGPGEVLPFEEPAHIDSLTDRLHGAAQ